MPDQLEQKTGEQVIQLFAPEGDSKIKEVREALDKAGLNYMPCQADGYAFMSGEPYHYCIIGFDSILFYAQKRMLRQKMKRGENAR